MMGLPRSRRFGSNLVPGAEGEGKVRDMEDSCLGCWGRIMAVDPWGRQTGEQNEPPGLWFL